MYTLYASHIINNKRKLTYFSAELITLGTEVEKLEIILSANSRDDNLQINLYF